MADRGPLQLLLAARRRPAGDRLLEVGVHALVRVQLRTVCGEVEDLDLRAVLGQPVPGQAGPVRLQPVQDEEDLAQGIPDQAPEEAYQVGAFTAPSTIIQRSSPRLVTAEIRLSPARLWQTRTSGVRPRGA